MNKFILLIIIVIIAFISADPIIYLLDNGKYVRLVSNRIMSDAFINAISSKKTVMSLNDDAFQYLNINARSILADNKICFSSELDSSQVASLATKTHNPGIYRINISLNKSFPLSKLSEDFYCGSLCGHGNELSYFYLFTFWIEIDALNRYWVS